MNPLQKRLSALRRRLWLVVTLRGGSWLLALVVGGALAAGALDWSIHLPGMVRALCLVGILGGAAVLAYRHLVRPLWARTDDLSLALRVEEQYPHLNDSLASTIQFLAQVGKTKMSGSSTMRREAVRQAMRQAQSCDFNKVVDKRGLYPGLLLFLAGAAGAFLLLAWYPAVAWTALARLADPFGEHDWPRQTQIEVAYEPRVPAGMPFAIHVSLGGVIPKEAVVEFEGLPVGMETCVVVPGEDGKTGSFAVPVDMTQQQGNFRFRIRANDATSPAREGTWHEVAVVQPPELTALRVRVEYPPYTDKKAEDLPSGYDTLDAPVVYGTRFRFEGTTDRPVARAWIACVPAEPQSLLSRAACLAPLAGQSSAEVLSLAAGLRGRWQVVPARLAPGGKGLSATLLPMVSGSYLLHWEDAEGIGQRRLFTINVRPDEAPRVELECLSLPARAALATANAELSLRLKATDDFAVRSLALEYRRKDKEGQFLDDGWTRVPVFDHAGAGGPVPGLVFSGLSGGQAPVLAPPLRLRLGQIEVRKQWPIEGLVKEGNILVVRAVADDFDDVSPGKAPGVSDTLEIEIASPPKVKAAIEEAMQRVQDQLAKLSMKKKPDSREPDALERVKNAEKKLADNKDLSPEEVENLRKVREEYKDVKDNIGNDPEDKDKLRGQVNRIRQSMKDNRLPRSTAQDQMDRVARSLRVLEDQIKEIQEGLDRVLRDEEDPADKRRKRELRRKDLEGVRERQQDMERTLRNLLDDLDPEVFRQVVQEKARRLRDEQEKIRQDTEKVTQDKKLEPDKRQAELNKLADRQKRLAEQAKNLLNEMKDAQDKREKKDPETARLLQNAVKAGNVQTEEGKSRVDEHMGEAEQDLRRDKTDNAKAKQEESRAALDRMVGALDKNREKELQNLSQKQQQEQDKLDQLRKDMAALKREAEKRREQDALAGAVGQAAAASRLQAEKQKRKKLQEEVDRLKKKIKEAEKIPDPKEREDRLKKLNKDLEDQEDQLEQMGPENPRNMEELAQEQRNLQKRAEQMARRLSRARADQAAEELRRASRHMEEAARQMDNGEEGDKQQEDALARLNNADQKLQQANDQVENELARERLAKVADEIKRLKEKQDKAVVASAGLHKDLLDEKEWTRGLRASLMRLRDERQKGLADDAAQLEEKLKSAPVFAHILGKTRQAMLRAADRMTRRLEAANERDGRKLTQQELAEENQADAETQKFQKEASTRLQRLLDALKNEPGKGGDQDPVPGDQDQQQPGGQGGGPPPASRDGIPPLAEQKALRAEQQEVYDRTKDFDRRHPELDNLPEEEKLKRLEGRDKDLQELKELHADQKTVRELANQLFAGAQQEGDKQ